MSKIEHALLLRGAMVYRHDGNTDLPEVADVLIRDGWIVAVGANLVNDPTIGAGSAEIVDLAGHLLLPGFVNAHYHSHDVLAKGAFESVPLEQWGLIAGPLANNRSLEEIRVRTLLGAVEALRNGITSVQDFSSFAPLRSEITDTILNAYREAGIRVIFSITARDRSQIDTILDAKKVIPEALWPAVGLGAGDPGEQLAFVENEIERIGSRDGMVIWALSPSAPQRCSPTLLSGMAELALRRNLPVYTHVYESRAQRHFCREHYPEHEGSIIRFMDACGILGGHVSIAHGVWPDPAEIDHLARSGTGVILNMLSNLRLRNGVAPIAAYRRLGVPLALGSDNCSCSDVHSMFPVMKMYCLMGGIMEPDAPAPLAAEAIRLGTLGGARTAGKSDELGAIEPRRRADLVALDLADPAFRPLHSVARQVVFAEPGRSVRHVWVNGKHVVRNGRTASVNENALLEAVAAVMPDVRDKLSQLRDDADRLSALFTHLQKKAWGRPLSYNRYLGAN